MTTIPCVMILVFFATPADFWIAFVFAVGADFHLFCCRRCFFGGAEHDILEVPDPVFGILDSLFELEELDFDALAIVDGV